MSKNDSNSAFDAKNAFLGKESYDTPLRKLTTWHIGGPAERLYYPDSLIDLANYFKFLSNSNATSNMPITWLGLGSNVLIRDGGIEGLVIVARKLNTLELISKDCVYAQAGVTCAKLARFCSENNLDGADFFAGIPGTVGGALAMNAGAFGGETWETVSQVETINRSGKINIRLPEEFKVSYRTIIGVMPEQQQEGFVGAIFKLKPKENKNTIRLLLQERNAKQPIGTRNCGSVFRNPSGDHAARLIEACDLKGFRLGGAIISSKHANFIINEDNATALDVERMISLIQSTVLEKFSIQLIPEVKILGKQNDEQ